MSQSSVESVVMSISEAVRLGRLVPGQRLVEAEYTKNFGVSRGTVREAFARLVSDGLLNFERHRGVTVRIMTRKQVSDLFKICESLECLAVRLALPVLKAQPETMLDTLANLGLAKAGNDLASYSRLNKEFHDYFYTAANNEMLTQLNNKLSGSVHGLQFRALMEVPGVTDSHQDHLDMAQAVLDGDPDKAEAITKAHIQNTHQKIESLPDDFFKSE